MKRLYVLIAALLVQPLTQRTSLAQETDTRQIEKSGNDWVPKDWTPARTKEGCTMAIPKSWLAPARGHYTSRNVFVSPRREIEVIVRVRPLDVDWNTIKQGARKSGMVVAENEDRIWTRWPSSPTVALHYTVRQHLSSRTSVCWVDINIPETKDLPAYTDVAKALAESVHAE